MARMDIAYFEGNDKASAQAAGEAVDRLLRPVGATQQLAIWQDGSRWILSVFQNEAPPSNVGWRGQARPAC